MLYKTIYVCEQFYIAQKDRKKTFDIVSEAMLKYNLIAVNPLYFYENIFEKTNTNHKQTLINMCKELLKKCDELWCFEDNICTEKLAILQEAHALRIPIVLVNVKMGQKRSKKMYEGVINEALYKGSSFHRQNNYWDNVYCDSLRTCFPRQYNNESGEEVCNVYVNRNGRQ